MAAIAAVTMTGVAVPAAAATLVVRSAGPSAGTYPPGKAIPDSARIVLQSNDQLVLLDGRGTRTLKGPGSFSPLSATSSGADARSTFAALVAQRSDRRARVGAVRGMSAAPAASPNIWFVDIDRSANVCVADPAALTVWRSATAKPDSVTVTDTAGKAETLAWPQDQPATAWPATLPITSGATYTINWAGAAQPTTVRFVVLGESLTGLEELAQLLIRNGCEPQLDRLIDTVALPETAAPAGS